MHAEPSIRDDATLLARWALEKNEEAFAEIVRQYERLVLGAAFRRTADMELARDVAQQVFATLAAKARLLLDRKNIAGWLYHAANHIASRSAQSERRRLAHQQSFEGADNGWRGGDSHALLIEEALAAIGATEREALLLHYFQDLAYPEIAVALGIEEPAARKRVSRGLHRLEKEMRRRGLKGSSAALLTAIAAQQSAFSSQAGLAAAAIAAGTTSSARWLAWSTMISSAPVKLLAGAAALTVAPLLVQWPINAELRAELGELRRTHAAEVVAPSRATESDIQMELAAKRSARIAAENRISELAALQEKLNDEVVISLGTIETMARKLARVVSNMNQLEIKSGRAPDDPTGLKQRQTKAGELAATIPEAMTIAREIPRIERDPARAAHFYATLAGEILGLDQETRMTMKGEIADWVQQLQRDGLALIQRPRGKDNDWDRRRDAATREFIARILKEVPLQNPAGPAMLEVFARNGNEGLYEFLTTEAVP